MSGDSQRPLAMEFINGKMEINTKVNGQTALSMDKVRIFLQMETSFLDPTDRASLKVLANTSGRTAAFISVNSRMD